MNTYFFKWKAPDAFKSTIRYILKLNKVTSFMIIYYDRLQKAPEINDGMCIILSGWL